MRYQLDTEGNVVPSAIPYKKAGDEADSWTGRTTAKATSYAIHARPFSSVRFPEKHHPAE